jgi:hypothetical protein
MGYSPAQLSGRETGGSRHGRILPNSLPTEVSLPFNPGYIPAPIALARANVAARVGASGGGASQP